jgi:hypothetical protein
MFQCVATPPSFIATQDVERGGGHGLHVYINAWLIACLSPSYKYHFVILLLSLSPLDFACSLDPSELLPVSTCSID